jgi:dihydroorotase
MGILLKSVQIIDPTSKLNNASRDVLIQRGKIAKIATNIPAEKNTVIKEKGLCVSPGWMDTCALFGDPGLEHKEDIASGLNATAHGGFTAVVTMPITNPVVDNKASVEYAKFKSSNHLVQLFPAGALSKKAQGKQLAEMLDMHHTGAIAFSDYKEPINNPELMHRALEYSKNFDGLILSFPFDNTIAPDGVWHEGGASVAHGVKGMPSISEEMRLSRDIEILRYTGGRMHVLMIKKAKKDGLNITCGVAAHQLHFSDQDMNAFDSDRKVNPPFRNSSDIKALKRGLKDGTIDVICSDHNAHEIESKCCEFQYAAFGISSIETTFATANGALQDYLSQDEIISKISTNPRAIFGCRIEGIQEGSEANLTLFNPSEIFKVRKADFKSKGKNTPFEGQELLGTVKGVIRGNSEIMY